MSRYNRNYSEGDIVTYSDLKRRNASYSSENYGRSDPNSANPGYRPDSSNHNPPYPPMSANDAKGDLGCQWPGYPCNPCGPCCSCDLCGSGVPYGIGEPCGPCAFYPCMCYPWPPMGPQRVDGGDIHGDMDAQGSADADSAPGNPGAPGGPGKSRYLHLCYPIMYYPFMSYPIPWPMSPDGPGSMGASGSPGTDGIPGGPGYLCVCYPAPCPHDLGGPKVPGTEAANAPDGPGGGPLRPFMCMCYLYPPKCHNGPGGMDDFSTAEAAGALVKPSGEQEMPGGPDSPGAPGGQGRPGANKWIPGYMYMCAQYPRPPICPHGPKKP